VLVRHIICFALLEGSRQLVVLTLGMKLFWMRRQLPSVERVLERLMRPDGGYSVIDNAVMLIL
jgi:hypothetical protein